MKNIEDYISMSPLNILVVEDDYLQADHLAHEIRTSGNHVVGPFFNTNEALYYIDTVQAAILDVRVQADTSFIIADKLSCKSIPFVFLTGYGKKHVPERFDREIIYLKPSKIAPILCDLQYQYYRSEISPETSIEEILKELIMTARAMMPDQASANRLVDAALSRAITKAKENIFTGDVRKHLYNILKEERLHRAHLYLH
ncbi:response regulator (plasmid) [Paracoccus liaowanqingii]|uniref:Response regulator n=1 Tax=Paracoccus liaowanqingii TaxID=2560053 RepID=A0A4Y5SW14_9RHOB|nr:response regulator [Paracoccus liaowanqingii]QDA37005.1 response regulator [Paracoccus liaowanqingii]